MSVLQTACDGLRVAAGILVGVAATLAPRRRRSSSGARRKQRSAILQLFVCFVGAFAVMLVLEVLFLPGGMPRLPGSDAAPVNLSELSAPMRAAAEAISALAASHLPARPSALSHLPQLPNISVVMPCFGHVKFQEEAIASVVHQEYPPAEIIVVDDGSEDRCGEHAQRILSETLAAPRRRQIELLIKWWGFGPSELGRFRDEVLLTPNRGVAHARNTGIRRARGDWICCLDADDMISPDYFLQGMSWLAQSPGTNLIYANQQFFYESKWQRGTVNNPAALAPPQPGTRAWNLGRRLARPRLPLPPRSMGVAETGRARRSEAARAAPSAPRLPRQAVDCARAARGRRHRARAAAADDAVAARALGGDAARLRRGAAQGARGLGLLAAADAPAAAAAPPRRRDASLAGGGAARSPGRASRPAAPPARWRGRALARGGARPARGFGTSAARPRPPRRSSRACGADTSSTPS